MILPLLIGLCFGYSGSGGSGVVLSFVVPQPQPSAIRSSRSIDTVVATQLLSTRSGSDDKDLPTPTPEVYPLSRKKILLIEEAKRLNASLSTSSASSSSSASYQYYSPAGWSNRLGSVLTPASIPGVYTADRPFYWNKIDVGCRMTVVQLRRPPSSSPSSSSSQGEEELLPELLIHSPVQLDPPLISALSQLGTVSHIISPNYEHVKYAQSWSEYYPHAKVWGCPGLMDRMPNARWTGELREGTRPPGYYHSSSSNPTTTITTTTRDNTSITTTTSTNPTTTEMKGGGVGYIDGMMWDWSDVQPLHINTEVNPFTGRPFFNEIVFYHTKSKTLIVTDLYWNYPRGDGVTNADHISLVEDEDENEDGTAMDATTASAAAAVVDDNDASLTDEENDDGDFGVWELAPNVGNIPLGSKIWGKIGMDKLFYPFYMNVMIPPEKRSTFEEIARYITCGSGGSGSGGGGWEVETIIPAHGDIVRGKTLCRRVLEGHFRIQCRP